MRTKILSITLAVILLAASNCLLVKEPTRKHSFNEIKEQFKHFMLAHNKIYKSVVEMEYRLMIFVKNFETILTHNMDNSQSFKMGLNQFADMSFEEISVQFLMNSETIKSNLNSLKTKTGKVDYELIKKLKHSRNSEKIKKDWREVKNVVTPVKNQGQCGSCWSFSTTGVLEGYFGIFENISVSLSEQELVDCSKNNGNHGCHGGYDSRALDYVKENGLLTEKDYPYIARDQDCKKIKGTRYTIKGYTEVKDMKYNQFAKIINDRPSSIYYEVTNSFMRYSSGVYKGDARCYKQINHAILAVAVDMNDSSDYAGDNSEFIVAKNSWSSQWGEKGYIKLGKTELNEKCGLLQYTLFIQ